VMAEPKITEACISLLEHVAKKPRREYGLSRGTASQAIAATNPVAWWRLNELTGPTAVDSSGNNRDAVYEPDVTFYLEGPHSEAFCENGETNRAAMFVGGRLQSQLPQLRDEYSVSLWFWNGMPDDSRAVSGWLFSRGQDSGLSQWSDHLGVGGTSGHSGKLIFFHGNDPAKVIAGTTQIPRWQWQHVVFVRNGRAATIYLNGKKEIKTEVDGKFPTGFNRVFAGGRSDNDSNWEGRLDEIAIFDRALTADEVSSLVK
jgi:hypothetical protein